MSDFVIHCGDALTVLRGLPDLCYVDCCITSPPYFGLRSYGAGPHEMGREATPEEYVDRLVEVFREVRRVLRDDGTAWLNLGDTYASNWPCNRRSIIGNGSLENGKRENRPPRMPNGLKEKDLIGIPWRVAFALQADGWYLRQDIIWHKPNPMTESVKDRCTKSHEYIFLLSKSSHYYYDSKAIAEPSVCGFNGSTFDSGKTQTHQLGRVGQGDRKDDGTRNKRSVWTVATEPCPEAHFATFPETLIEPCVLAGCREGGLILDPFSGAGTTGVVSLKANRNYVGIELNPEYVEMSRRRLHGVGPLLNREIA